MSRLNGNVMHGMMHKMCVGMYTIDKVVFNETSRLSRNAMHEMMHVMHVGMQMGD